MKMLSFIIIGMITGCSAIGKETIYRGSTPAHAVVRQFLGISLIDSIDFIRWQLVIHPGTYTLSCEYGLARGGTNGFANEKKIGFSGQLKKQGHYYSLLREGKTFSVLEINSSLLHLLDENNNLLVGNGGYSCVLNSTTPVKSSRFNHPLQQTAPQPCMVFQGRTPCQELSVLLGRKSSAACNKLKWYIILYTDSATQQPSWYLEGGRGYKKESMAKGRWAVIQQNGRIIYKLDIDRRAYPLYLLKADDNILFFIDADGNLLVGNEHFSYTLNRTIDREPALNK